jgi:hypothetical protein
MDRRRPVNNRKGMVTAMPSQKSTCRPIQGYDEKAAEQVRNMCPSWDMCDLEATVRQVLTLARGAKSGYSDAAILVIPGVGLLDLEFDGKGGVEITEATTHALRMMELLCALRFTMGSKLTEARSHQNCAGGAE